MTEILNPQPVVVVFLCKWCSGNAADLAGTTRMKYPENAITIQTPCSGRVAPSYVFNALMKGADGVMVSGCHPGECHYINGNYKTLKRMELVKKLAKQIGIEDVRVRLEWFSASEAKKFVTVVGKFIEQLKHLPPNPLGKQQLITPEVK
jgi:F420-non-reducing hydrogenase iron-sulfur subunit